jgi:hypothetical protein
MKISNSYKLFDVIISFFLTIESFEGSEEIRTTKSHLKKPLRIKQSYITNVTPFLRRGLCNDCY